MGKILLGLLGTSVCFTFFNFSSAKADLNINVENAYTDQDCSSLIFKLGKEFDEYKAIKSWDKEIYFQGSYLPDEFAGYDFMRTVCTAEFLDFSSTSKNRVLLHQSMVKLKKNNRNFLNLCQDDMDQFKKQGLFPLVIKTTRSFVFNKPNGCYAIAVEFKP